MSVGYNEPRTFKNNRFYYDKWKRAKIFLLCVLFSVLH